MIKYNLKARCTTFTNLQVYFHTGALGNFLTVPLHGGKVEKGDISAPELKHK